MRPLPETGHSPELERREVIAGEVADEVGRAQDERAVEPLHLEIVGAARVGLSVTASRTFRIAVATQGPVEASES